jgi:hypothetical protein
VFGCSEVKEISAPLRAGHVSGVCSPGCSDRGRIVTLHSALQHCAGVLQTGGEAEVLVADMFPAKCLGRRGAGKVQPLHVTRPTQSLLPKDIVTRSPGPGRPREALKYRAEALKGETSPGEAAPSPPLNWPLAPVNSSPENGLHRCTSKNTV